MKRARGRPKMNARFELYVWIAVEMLRDREPPLPRHSEVMGCKLFSRHFQTGWSDNTVRTHVKRARSRAEADEYQLVADIRRWRTTLGWNVDVTDLLVALDTQWRRMSFSPQN